MYPDAHLYLHRAEQAAHARAAELRSDREPPVARSLITRMRDLISRPPDLPGALPGAPAPEPEQRVPAATR
ncbi:MAG TPA: hypothetical protein VK875_09490 [Euzebyales bacterium]|nr:hypothetical protein [Euzebyales bacterium]